MAGGEGKEHFSMQCPHPKKAKRLMAGTLNQDVSDSSILITSNPVKFRETRITSGARSRPHDTFLTFMTYLGTAKCKTMFNKVYIHICFDLFQM